MEVQFNKPAVYIIKVQGEIGDDWSNHLGGMQITVERKKGAKSITMITGRIKDQSALSGILNTLYELHLPVISVKALEND